MQRTDEQQAIQLLSKKLSSFKGKLTASDAATATGLAIHETKDALEILMNQFACKLQVTEQGEILYDFGSTLRRRGEKTFRERLEEIEEVAWKIFKAVFKVWITVMLVVYFVIFVTILLALLLGGSRGKGSKKVKLNWVFDFLGDLFTATARGNMLLYATDPGGYRHKRYAQTTRRDPTQLEPKKRFVQSIYDYVFGPDRAAFDPLANAKEAAAYLRTSNGILTTSDIVALAGYDFSEADERMTDYLTRFRGHADITEDGVLYGSFNELLRSGDAETQEAKVELFWNEYEAPFELTGNTSGRNTFITFANAFNLVFSFLFLTGGIELGYEDITFDQGLVSIVLGWIPFVFSFLFFLVPAIRSFDVKKRERARKERNVKRRIVRAIFERTKEKTTLEQILEAVNRGPEEKLSATVIETYLNALLIELQGTSDFDDHGTVRYHFPRIAREEETASKLRVRANVEEREIGKVIYNT